MRFVCPAGVALALLTSSICGQAQSLSITNYQVVSQFGSNITYRADLVNSGPALAAVTATVASLDPFTIRVVSGQLDFQSVPANGRVTSTGSFRLFTNPNVPLDASKLQWTFQVTAGAPVANAGPNQIVNVGNLVTLNGGGSTNPSGAGTLTYSWAFTSRPGGSMAFLGHSSSVTPTFVVDVAGSYVISLTISNGTATSTASVTVSTNVAPAPVANPGSSKSVTLGSTVILNGSGSTSGSGNPLTYAWTLTSRPPTSTATLTGAATISPSFVADKPGTYIAQLIVNDGLASSVPVPVTITTQIVKPVANAGTDRNVTVNALVQLDGSKSTDGNGLPLTYLWNLNTLPPTSAAKLSNTAIVNPTFTPDVPGTYVVQLIVNNGTLASDAVTVMITTQSTLAPTANAGSNRTVTLGSSVTLNGGGSDPQSLPLTYQWLLLNKPNGSAASLSSATIPNPAFIADLIGSYVAQLVVNNGVLSSQPSTVTISTTCTAPTANPGSARSVSVGATVTLDGSASGDVCQGPLTYAWTFTTRPGGSTATLTGANTVTPSFVADVAGMYAIQLIVNNGVTASNPVSVGITATSPAGGADIVLPANVVVPPGQTAPFQVTLSKPAASGGVFIMLSSSDTSKATIAPANIFIGPGAMTANRAPVLTGVNAGSVTITAAAFGLTAANQLVYVGTGPTGPTLSFSQGSLTITGTATQNLTLNLSAPVPAGLTVNLGSSNTGVATVPGTVNFGPNVISMPVPVTGVAVGSTTITASAAGIPNATAGVTVIAPPAVSVPANTTVAPAQSVTFPITLTAPAPAQGVTVFLVSNNTQAATITPSVFVAGGATTPASQPQVAGVAAGSAGISATASGYTAGSGQVQVVVGGGTSSLTPSPLSVTAGSTGNLTLTLTAPAPAGLTATLNSNNTAVASVPATVSFTTGALTSTVQVSGLGQGAAIISAVTPNFGSASANVNVSAAPSGLILQSNVVVPVGQTVFFQVSLGTPAPAGGVFVTLSSSDASKLTIAPVNIFIPQGMTAPYATPRVTGVDSGSASVNATATGFSPVSKQVQVGSGAALSLSPGSLAINVNSSQNLLLTLSSSAPLGGQLVNISSDNPGVASVPSTVTVPASGTTVNVQVIGVAQGTATISATSAGFVKATAGITVGPSAAIVLPAGVTLAPGGVANFPVTLASPAPVNGVTVNLASTDTSRVTISPAQIFFAQGATTSAVTPAITGVSFGAANITATATVGSASQQVTIAAGLSMQPGNLVITGASVTQNFTLTLSAPAPAGLTLSLKSSATNVATVPSTVQVPLNATTVNLPVTSVGPGTAVIQAGAVPVFPATAAFVTVVSTPSVILPVFQAVGVAGTVELPVSLSTPAPAGGITVSLSSSDPTKFTVTPSVFIAGGMTTPATQPRITGGPTLYSEGFSTVYATAPGYAYGSLDIHVADSITITLQFNASIGIGQTAPLPVALPYFAPPGGVKLTFTSSNPSLATITPTAFVPGGANMPLVPPMMTGLGQGSVFIEVSGGPDYITGVRRLDIR